jgi:hypothetical protein
MGTVNIVRSQRRVLPRFIFSRMSPGCFCVIVLALFMSSASGVHAQVDVTEKVRRYTALDKAIGDFCASYCQGNRREGRLTAVTVKPIGNGRYRGTMTAELRNRQDAGEPFNVTIYDWIVKVRAEALLDESSCMVVIDSVTVDNDMYGILSGVLDEQKGQKHQISNCKRLLP